MNFRNLVFVLALAASTSAGAITVGYNPRSGDVWIDTSLRDINRYGYDDRDYFVDDMVRQFGAPRYLVNDLLGPRKWQPGDVYYACALAYQTRRPCADVVRMYDQNRGQGWGVIAQRMGIKPGSREFFALKDGLRHSHGRYQEHIKLHGPGAKGEHGPGDHPGKGNGKDKGHGNGNGKGNGNGNGHGNGGGR
jgi:hypothetical protein